MIFRRHEQPRPADVFVPSKLPLEEQNAYAAREEAEQNLDRYVTRGQIPVVFGEFGVGKTTLVRRYFRDADEDGRLVYIATASGKSIRDIVQTVLEHLDYAVEVERTTSDTRTLEGGVQWVARATGGRQWQSGTREQLVVTSPTDNRLIGLMTEAEVVLVVDEMHKASPELRSALVDLMKVVRSGNDNFPVIAVIGTTMDAEQLVTIDPGIDRFVKELLVSPMTDDEAREVVSTGFDTLGMSIPDALVESVVRTAAGAPTIVQEVCLNMAEHALADDREEVNDDDYADAIRTYLHDHGRRLASVYVKAIEQVGPRRYRKQILLAMSNLPHDFANMEDIRSGVSNNLDEVVQATALSGPLRVLKTGEDSILQDVQRQDGDRVYNLNAFRDPMMKSFIRFMAELEDQGLLPPDRIKELRQE